MIYSLANKKPQCSPDAWIAPSAVIIGNVTLKANTSIWWNAVLRGDEDLISIDEGSNVQDNAVLHTDPGYPLTIGCNVTIGHLAMIHGCTIQDHCLIGIGAVILNGAVIGANSIVGASALITENQVFEPNSLIIGQPARRIKEVTSTQKQAILDNALSYQARFRDYQNQLQELTNDIA